MPHAIRLDGATPVRLAAIDPDAHGGLEKTEGEARAAALADELGELQELLYAARRHAVLVVLQGMDASGKDGAVRHVFKEVNPAGCRVVPFKAPTPPELARDFLWRVHQQVPEKGLIVVFNRSHYEDVLAARVKGLVPEPVWRDRYGQINAFEHLLVANGTLVLKCFLHISKEEQEERLLARERDVAKAWKLNAGDWVDRRLWDAYRVAYEDALDATATPAAPWYVVPADRKWFRDLAIAELVVGALRPHRDGWQEDLRRRGEAELAAVHAARAAVAMRAPAVAPA